MIKIKDIAIFGRLWRDGNGNTYHTSSISVNGKHVHTTDRTYGYGDQYVYTALEWLGANRYITYRRPDAIRTTAEKNGIKIAYEAAKVARKKDL